MIGTFLGPSSKAPARQQHPHPQRPASPQSTHCSVSLRCSTSRAFRRASPGCWPSPPKRGDRALVTYLTEAEVDALLGAPYDPDTLDRATRPRPAATRHPDRATDLRTHRPHHTRRPPRHRRARRLPRQRPQGTDHPAHRTDTVTTLCELARRTATAHQALRCSLPAGPASVSAATPWSTASPNTPRPQHSDARAWQPSESPPTSCATPPRCGYCTPASTPPSSRSGSGHEKASRQHADLPASPTSTSKNEAIAQTRPSPGSPHRADTTRRTASSPGSKDSDYADLASTKPMPCKGIQHDHVMA